MNESAKQSLAELALQTAPIHRIVEVVPDVLPTVIVAKEILSRNWSDMARVNAFVDLVQAMLGLPNSRRGSLARYLADTSGIIDSDVAR